ncbi:MAG TPA: glycosyltransferase family 1 protein [Vicinamibacterales bacterium]|nr:glycosyltransferase family 1 protein [Vicinamibacterales bacterium]
MRIGIDGRAFTSPAAGVRRYATHLVSALMDLGEPLQIVALGGDPAMGPPGIEHIAERAHPPTNLGWTLMGLPAAAARARVDLIHAPAYTAPFVSRAPVVLTIHDVSYERHPEWYPYRRDWMRRAFYRRSARAAAHILTDSAFSAREISEAYAIDPARITVAPLGVGSGFAAGDPDAPMDLPAGVTTPFVLHVGDLHERRNLPVVVDAVLEARRHFGGAAAVSLVLAGVDRGVGEGLCAMAAAAGVPEAVVRLGAVEDDRLQVLYRGASALVYPSRYEGFGLPVLEAMASGTPVIASRAASIPEVLGDCGILLDPDDRGGWTDAIVRMLNDEHLRADLHARGVARAATFSWARTARITYAVYVQAVGRDPRFNLVKPS